MHGARAARLHSGCLAHFGSAYLVSSPTRDSPSPKRVVSPSSSDSAESELTAAFSAVPRTLQPGSPKTRAAPTVLSHRSELTDGDAERASHERGGSLCHDMAEVPDDGPPCLADRLAFDRALLLREPLRVAPLLHSTPAHGAGPHTGSSDAWHAAAFGGMGLLQHPDRRREGILGATGLRANDPPAKRPDTMRQSKMPLPNVHVYSE